MISKASITGSPEELILFNPTFQFEKDMYEVNSFINSHKIKQDKKNDRLLVFHFLFF